MDSLAKWSFRVQWAEDLKDKLTQYQPAGVEWYTVAVVHEPRVMAMAFDYRDSGDEPEMTVFRFDWRADAGAVSVYVDGRQIGVGLSVSEPGEIASWMVRLVESGGP